MLPDLFLLLSLSGVSLHLSTSLHSHTSFIFEYGYSALTHRFHETSFFHPITSWIHLPQSLFYEFFPSLHFGTKLERWDAGWELTHRNVFLLPSHGVTSKLYFPSGHWCFIRAEIPPIWVTSFWDTAWLLGSNCHFIIDSWSLATSLKCQDNSLLLDTLTFQWWIGFWQASCLETRQSKPFCSVFFFVLCFFCIHFITNICSPAQLYEWVLQSSLQLNFLYTVKRMREIVKSF